MGVLAPELVQDRLGKEGPDRRPTGANQVSPQPGPTMPLLVGALDRRGMVGSAS
jgi:hypothetical protein